MPSSNTLLDLLTGTAPTAGQPGFNPQNPLNLDLSPEGIAAMAAATRADNPTRDPDFNISGGLTSNNNGPGTPMSELPVDVQNSANQSLIDWGNMDESWAKTQLQDPTPLVLGALAAIAAPFALSAFGLGGAAAGAGGDILTGSVGGDILTTGAAGAGAAGAGATASELVVTAAAAGMSIPEIAAATGLTAAAVGGILSSSGGGPTNTLPGAGNQVPVDNSNVASGVTVSPSAGPPTNGLTGLPVTTLPTGNPLAPAPTPDLTNIDPGTLPQATDPNGGLTPLPLATVPQSSSLDPAPAPDLNTTPIVAPSLTDPSSTGGFNPTSLISPAIGAAGTIAGAAVGANAASDAAAVQQNIWNQTQTNLQPFINAGTGALPQLENLTGTGPGGIAGEEAALRQTPGYQFQMDEGLNALLSKSTATGGVGGGNTLKGLLTYSQGLADSNYQQQVNNTYQLASLGENAGAHLGTIGTQAGSNIGNTLTQGANATTAGITGLTNQITGFLGTPAGASFLANLGH